MNTKVIIIHIYYPIYVILQVFSHLYFLLYVSLLGYYSLYPIYCRHRLLLLHVYLGHKKQRKKICHKTQLQVVCLEFLIALRGLSVVRIRRNMKELRMMLCMLLLQQYCIPTYFSFYSFSCIFQTSKRSWKILPIHRKKCVKIVFL